MTITARIFKDQRFGIETAPAIILPNTQSYYDCDVINRTVIRSINASIDDFMMQCNYIKASPNIPNDLSIAIYFDDSTNPSNYSRAVANIVISNLMIRASNDGFNFYLLPGSVFTVPATDGNSDISGSQYEKYRFGIINNKDWGEKKWIMYP